MASQLVTLIALSLAVASGSAAPTDDAVPRELSDQTAQCGIHWLISQSCKTVITPLSEAIQNWMFVNQCGFSPAGETCEYVSEDLDDYSVRGIRMTFTSGFVSDFGFVVYGGGQTIGDTCHVRAKGFTTKDVITDLGFNYCSLQWMMTDSKLTTLYGYSMGTESKMCPEMMDAVCSDNMALLAAGADNKLSHDAKQVKKDA